VAISPLNKELTRIHPRIDPKNEEPGVQIRLKKLTKKMHSAYRPERLSIYDNNKEPPKTVKNLKMSNISGKQSFLSGNLMKNAVPPPESKIKHNPISSNSGQVGKKIDFFT